MDFHLSGFDERTLLLVTLVSIAQDRLLFLKIVNVLSQTVVYLMDYAMNYAIT